MTEEQPYKVSPLYLSSEAAVTSAAVHFYCNESSTPFYHVDKQTTTHFRSFLSRFHVKLFYVLQLVAHTIRRLITVAVELFVFYFST